MKVYLGILCFLLASPSKAQDSPVYLDGMLGIPSVYSEGKSGMYQDAIFMQTESNKWELLEYKVGKLLSTDYVITSVELTKVDSFPVQVFLKLEGKYIDGCQLIGQVKHQLTGNTLEVFVYEDNESYIEGILCTTAEVPFSTTFPLPVYSLNSGTYEVRVNGEYPQFFSLEVDNYFLDNTGG